MSVPEDIQDGLVELRSIGFGEVADTLLALLNDNAVSPAAFEMVCDAIFLVLNAWADLA